MILLTHKGEEVFEIIDLETNQIVFNTIKNPIKAMFIIANKYKERILVWCHYSLKEHLNIDGIKESFQLKNTMLSYCEDQYLPKQIGYVEDSPFLKVNKFVKYPTWLMSSQVGAIYGSELLKFENKIKLSGSFDFVLNSIAKLGMPKGLFCYSEPKILIQSNKLTEEHKASTFQLFKFVKLHYKSVWVLLLLISYIIYERKFPILPFINSLFYKKIKTNFSLDLESISNSEIDKNKTVDVIIPTLGRKQHVCNFLIDLTNQTLLPNQVIIIEQNQDQNSKSELDFISNKTWPFKIIHKFTHTTGACNARNLALKKVTSKYVFLADDDIRIQPNHIEYTINKMLEYQLAAVTLSCLQKKDIKTHLNQMQWSTFGSGCSVVKSICLKGLTFDMNYEFSFGEDSDFGMQLRNNGVDVIYLPEPEIEHVKAPIGGFRTSFEHIWTLKGDKPKPSPAITYYKLKHQTTKQLKGYKLVLFLKFYKAQSIKNPFKYYKTFKKQWQQSIYWANQMKNNLV
ncbi:glycosyltransferase family 2 protein [Sabulilitoribacter multivorans]|uniref:Glycosyltransferase family 2 protein n=1 Tax=Flaviramulus multivorans TaxID=1304750 RepID=A0ABS9II40_9FLAO|nr:glycosyltransferase family A protein [Flaviramulus multivorans]MCF7560310.1 glycosyltransferase family 2 protein [Flaviramulus multivorans]